jgi:hypothetical protein
VSSFPPWRSLADLSRCYARGKQGVNQRTTRKQKEKIHVAIISAKRNATRISGAVQQREDNSICWEKCAVIAWETLPVSACPHRRSRMAAAVQAADCRLC